MHLYSYIQDDSPQFFHLIMNLFKLITLLLRTLIFYTIKRISCYGDSNFFF